MKKNKLGNYICKEYNKNKKSCTYYIKCNCNGDTNRCMDK
jgi:hypothetical protein